MSLSSSTMADALAAIGPQDSIAAAAEKWFKAWFDYAKGCSVLLPAAAGAESSVKTGFVSTLKGGMTPDKSPDAFFKAFEDAMKGGWLILGASPYLMTTYASITPATATLSLSGVPPIGVKSKTADKPAKKFADAVHDWTITYAAIDATSGAPVPFS